MRSLVPFLITGIVTGSLYGLAGIGLVLTYRTSGVMNFGHGAVAAAAAYLFYTVHVTHGLAWPLAVIVTIAGFGVCVGYGTERLTRGLGNLSQAVAIVATVGLMLGIQGLLFVQYGASTRDFPEFLPGGGFTVSGVNVSWSQVISIAVASGSTLGLYLYLRRSRTGVAMRAVVENPTLISLSGEFPTRVRTTAWMIGSAFAALSGILLAPTLGLDATLLTLLVVQAFGACAIGTFSNLPLTYAGGILVGILSSVATKYASSGLLSGLPSSMPFLVLLVVLLFVPPKRFPQPRAAVQVSRPPRPALTRAGMSGRLVGLVVLLVVPVVVGTKLPVWITGLTYAVLFGSLALLVWTSGQISLCHMAFAAVGATTMGHLSGVVPWPLALLLAGLATVPVGALVAVPALRLSGIYLALATLGFGILMQNVVFNTGLMFGPRLVATASRPQIRFVEGTSDTGLYYVTLIVAVSAWVLLSCVSRGRLGRLLRAMAETPTMLTTHGLGVNTMRLLVFCTSACLAGIAGALIVTQFGSVSSVGFGPIQSLLLLVVLALCGTGLFRSSILAAALFTVLPGYLTTFGTERQLLVFGTGAALAVCLRASRPAITGWLERAAACSEGRSLRGPVRARTRSGNDRREPAPDGCEVMA
jgi:branched-subunit amino acid ABC-type transport system permease component